MNTGAIAIASYFQLAKIYESSHSRVYRGRRELDGQAVIVKVLKEDYPSASELTRYRTEYKITRSLNLAGVIKAYSLEKYQNTPVMILEDFGGESLTKLRKESKFPLKELLAIAIQVAESLAGVHAANIIHKDINPSNLVFNRATGQAKLIDFGISSILSRENPTIKNPEVLEGTLPYMSPEQTGRMNRFLDYRTDFYSFGVTLYELLTETLPCTGEDALELVHCHLAKQPIPPYQINPEIPKTVSDIVLKLMAKTAEERYQSGWGIKADLEECLEQLTAKSTISDFPLGCQDIAEKFQIPQKLYGREREIETLLAAFNRIADRSSIPNGPGELMLVSGYSGIGKSALVQEIYKPITRQKGYFIDGKFDQYQRNIPYFAVIQALKKLVRQLLTEKAVTLKQWRDRLLAAVGSNGQVIIEVIPEIELILGKQPNVPALPPTESLNRFNLVFQNVIRAIAQPEHPLVIFLDDLQWADAASVKLMHLLMTSPDSQSLFLIGAYRDNEVSATHPLIVTVKDIQETGAIVNQISLSPLQLADANQLIADALYCHPNTSLPLTKLVVKKTRGNPFFLNEFLKALYVEQLLEFDGQVGCWHWDLEKIEGQSITDNVVELLAGKMLALPEKMQVALKLAACIGNQFDLTTLATIYEKSAKETVQDLQAAVSEGLILPLDERYQDIALDLDIAADSILAVTYKFAHDRIQQAAYSLIPESEKKQTHWKIGQLLLESTPTEKLAETIFDLVNQLNLGKELITAESEKSELARLNLIAGQKAKASAAFAGAQQYFNIGLGLLAENSWEREYDLTLSLHVEATEAEFLNTNFDRAECLAQIVLQQAKTLLDKVKVYELKIQFAIAANQMFKAIEIGLSVVEMLGVSLSELPSDGVGVVKLPQLEELDNIPIMTDPYKLAAMRIFAQITAATVISGQIDKFVQVILTMVKLSVEYGHSALAAVAYVDYGMILCGAQELDAGYYAGQLALKLVEQFAAKEIKSKVDAPFNGLIRHWKEPAIETLAPLLEGMQSGIETGDYEYAGICAGHYSNHIFWIGESLESVEKKQESYQNLAVQLQQDSCVKLIEIFYQLTLNLQGDAENKYRLIGKDFDEEAMLSYLHEVQNGGGLFSLYLAKVILRYLFKDYEKAIANARLALEYGKGGEIGMMAVVSHNFYYSLALLAQYSQVNSTEQKEYLNQVEENQKRLHYWANNSPQNYQHKYDLVEAEKARVAGDILKPMEYYDRAIAGAKANEFIQEEAIANELAGEFYLSGGREKVAKTYLTDAYYGYKLWGAKAKLEDLEASYPEFFSRRVVKATPKITTGRKLTTTQKRSRSLTSEEMSAELDLKSVLKASQALSSEIVLDLLLDKLMKIVLENAGADSGFLILERQGTLRIEASGLVGEKAISLRRSVPVETSEDLPLSVVMYVARTQENVVLNNATEDEKFAADPYIQSHQPKSLLCAPILSQGRLIGMIYLENNLATEVFTRDRLEILKILTTQAAISLENAILYTNLEEKVAERTQELHQKSLHLTQMLEELQSTQAQLIQTEKMSSLGQMVAGIAHEINNPVSFIYGNIDHTHDYIKDLLYMLEAYQQEYPNPSEKLADIKDDIEFDYLVADLPKMLGSMKVGAERIRDIVRSLRNFSRLDESDMKPVDIHDGIDSTLMILQHRLKKTENRPEIVAIKEYGKLPAVNCYASQLNQVFMNILSNAIDALEMRQPESSMLTITIKTKLKSDVRGDRAIISITDNGSGMSEDVRQKIFDPFFTTKPVGSGTGLGLSISYKIVVEYHGGQLSCVSAPGEGATFVVEIPIRK